MTLHEAGRLRRLVLRLGADEADLGRVLALLAPSGRDRLGLGLAGGPKRGRSSSAGLPAALDLLSRRRYPDDDGGFYAGGVICGDCTTAKEISEYMALLEQIARFDPLGFRDQP